MTENAWAEYLETGKVPDQEATIRPKANQVDTINTRIRAKGWTPARRVSSNQQRAVNTQREG